jgi:hypothetical protein
VSKAADLHSRPIAETQNCPRPPLLKHRTDAETQLTQMLKHGAATQSEIADAETRSCYTVRGRKMLKHGASTQSRVADAETQRNRQNRRC